MQKKKISGLNNCFSNLAILYGLYIIDMFSLLTVTVWGYLISIAYCPFFHYSSLFGIFNFFSQIFEVIQNQPEIFAFDLF